MKKLTLCLTALAMGTLMSFGAPRQADARPQYLKAFTEKYDAVAPQAKELKCGVCHGEGGKKKKVLSDYGKALGHALGAKNVKDGDDIMAALNKAAGEDAGNGKTYGDLLKAGMLPPAAP